jgi:hypothetical protein
MDITNDIQRAVHQPANEWATHAIRISNRGRIHDTGKPKRSGKDSKKGGSAEGRPTRQGRRSRLGGPLGREQLLGGLPQASVNSHILA